MTSDRLVPIGEAARRTGVATSALRYYDELGLVPPARRVGRRRYYGQAELRRLAFVQLAQRLGIGLAGIAEILNGAGRSLRRAADSQIVHLDQQIGHAEAARALLWHGRECPHPQPWRDCPYMVQALDTWLAAEGSQAVDERFEEVLSGLRRAYGRGELDEATVERDPLTQFRNWLHDAIVAEVPEPNAVVLATASTDGLPAARTVLLKGLDERGFVFFTNLESDKARDLAANPRAALVFPWHAMERQVRVTGTVSRTSTEETAAYFASRPRESRLGAWASRQSSVVSGRDELDRAYAEAAERWPEGTDVPLPEFWGGFRVAPSRIEFWQGRQGRLHDRIRYRRESGTGPWVIERLAP